MYTNTQKYWMKNFLSFFLVNKTLKPKQIKTLSDLELKPSDILPSDDDIEELRGLLIDLDEKSDHKGESKSESQKKASPKEEWEDSMIDCLNKGEPFTDEMIKGHITFNKPITDTTIERAHSDYKAIMTDAKTRLDKLT